MDTNKILSENLKEIGASLLRFAWSFDKRADLDAYTRGVNDAISAAREEIKNFVINESGARNEK